jgi:hypothetical protein
LLLLLKTVDNLNEKEPPVPLLLILEAWTSFAVFLLVSTAFQSPGKILCALSQLTICGRLVTDADCPEVNFHGRRASINRLIEHANLINYFCGFIARLIFKRSVLIKEVLEEVVDA